MRTFDPAFVPPFCPNPRCSHHAAPGNWRPLRHGTFTRSVPPRVIRRFRCPDCFVTFSSQTFDTTYYLKKPELQIPLFDFLATCTGFRQAARALRVNATSLQRQASRLGRHCLLFQQVHGPAVLPQETLVLDGFVTFEYSQYWPFEINVLVGEDSHFVYGFLDAELRRSGRMTLRQKKRRAALESLHGRPDPKDTARSIEDLVRVVAPVASPLTLWSDEHAAYPRAFRRLPHAIVHRTVSSRRCRTRNNPLFAVDLLDLLIRHVSSNHKRETIAFSKRRQGALERMAVLQVWRNFRKRVSERKTDSVTPAQALGLAKRLLLPEEILARRLFPTRVPLPEPLRRYYFREVPTRQIPNGTRHDLKRAA